MYPILDRYINKVRTVIKSITRKMYLFIFQVINFSLGELIQDDIYFDLKCIHSHLTVLFVGINFQFPSPDRCPSQEKSRLRMFLTSLVKLLLLYSPLQPDLHIYSQKSHLTSVLLDWNRFFFYI